MPNAWVRTDKRIEVHCPSDLPDGIVVPCLGGQVGRVVQTSRRKRRIEVERAQERLRCARPVPIVDEPDVPQRRVRVGDRLIQTDRGLGGLFSLRHRVSRVYVEAGELRVGFCQPGVGRCVQGIPRDSGLEVVQGLSQSVLRGLLRVVTGQQHLSMHLGIDWPCACQARLLAGRQPDTDQAGDRSASSLCRANTSRRSRSKLCAQMTSPVGPADQSGVDADLAVRPRHRAFDDGVDLQFPRDGRHRLRCRPVVHDRCARDHAESVHRRKVGNELLRHPVGKVFLFRIAGQVVQRQNRDGSNLA